MTESSPRNQPFCIVTRFRFHNVGLKHEIVRVYYAAMNRLRLERVPPRQMPSEEIPIDLRHVVLPIVAINSDWDAKAIGTVFIVLAFGNYALALLRRSVSVTSLASIPRTVVLTRLFLHGYPDRWFRTLTSKITRAECFTPRNGELSCVVPGKSLVIRPALLAPSLIFFYLFRGIEGSSSVRLCSFLKPYDHCTNR
jgi:hypothetical protein